MTRTEFLRRRLANQIAAQIALDVAGGRDLDEALEDATDEGERLEREGAEDHEWVSGDELLAAYLRVCPARIEAPCKWDVPPPY